MVCSPRELRRASAPWFNRQAAIAGHGSKAPPAGLAAIGRGNLSVGRIYEGHVNALLLIQWFGSASQRKRFETYASEGALLGVWNTDLPENPIRIENGLLRGAKSFASGADGLSHAVITVPREGRQMLIVPVKGLSIDRTWWKPLGMRASGSTL
jgi:hypothetical protein